MVDRLTSWRKRTQEEQDAQSFPDEIDTPQDTPARTRFARFRGLQSLRTSPWDPYENLPREYARIFEFEDFKRTERDMWRELEDDGVEVGNSAAQLSVVQNAKGIYCSPVRA
jgi:pre-rRNA-processing protein TSR1